MAETTRQRHRRQFRETAGLSIKLAAEDVRGTSEGPATWETIKAAYSRWTDEEVDAAIAAAAEEEGA